MGVLREQLTLFMGDSPVDNLSPWLESKKDRTTKDIYGLNFRGWSPKLSRVGSLLKTYLGLSNLPLTTFVRVWSVSATPSGYGILKLRLSERRTAEQESSLWATPNTMDHLPQRSKEALTHQASVTRKGRKRPSNLREQVNPETCKLWRTPDAGCARGAHSKETFNKKMAEGWPLTLNDQVAHLFPTPDASVMNLNESVESVLKRREKYKTKWGNNGFGLRLATMVKMFPTPRVFMYKDSATDRGKSNLGEVVGGSLNPAWVEWLMGFPIGWTDIGG